MATFKVMLISNLFNKDVLRRAMIFVFNYFAEVGCMHCDISVLCYVVYYCAY